MTVSFTVYGVAAPAGSKTTGVSKAGTRFVRDSNPASQHWKTEVKATAGKIMAESETGLLEGPLGMILRFYRPRPKSHYGAKGNVKDSAPGFPTGRPDSTKLTRGVEDAMTGIVYRDDSQIVSQSIGKYWGEPARVEITLWELDVRSD